MFICTFTIYITRLRSRTGQKRPNGLFSLRTMYIDILILTESQIDILKMKKRIIYVEFSIILYVFRLGFYLFVYYLYYFAHLLI